MWRDSELPGPGFAVQVKSVCKTYPAVGSFRSFITRKPPSPGRRVLSNVNFDVRPGESVALVGGNGAGKSTLLQIVCGTVAPTCGKVVRAQRTVAILDAGHAFRHHLTGRENARFLGLLFNMTRRGIDARMAEIAAFSGLEADFERPLRHYSTGMAARLAIGVALHADPEVIVFDESLATVDLAFQDKCAGAFANLIPEAAKLLVAHDERLVRSMANRVIALDDGVMTYDGPAMAYAGRPVSPAVAGFANVRATCEVP